ncbi:MAG: hypothetical protein QXS85_02280 [Acidilobaceae archaeon]
MRECTPRLDFLRHIFNATLVEKSWEKLPPTVVIEELKKRMARAEDKFKFSIYGGDPRRLVDFLDSDEWREIVNYAKSMDALWILEEALKKLEREYEASCPDVAAKVGTVLASLAGAREYPSSETKRQEITLDVIARRLKLEGIQADIVIGDHGTKYIQVERPLLKAKIEVSDGVIKYEVCRSGKASTIEGLIAALRKYESA